MQELWKKKNWEQLDKSKPHYYLTKFTAAMSYPSNSRISITRGMWKTYPIGRRPSEDPGNMEGALKRRAECRTREREVAEDLKTEFHSVLENWS